MKSRPTSLVSLLVITALVAPTWATDLGDPAPPLKVAEWVKGDPVDIKEGVGKNVYVIEFWATWCGPCIVNIPHLTKLQKDYRDKGVIIVSVSVDGERTRGDVTGFVKKRNDDMGYTVALDTKDGDTAKAYMKAFMVMGIPNAFIVDRQGKLAWQGHPMEMEPVLKAVLEGNFDLEAAKKADRERRRMVEKRVKAMEVIEKYFSLITSSENPDEAQELGQKALAAIDPKDAMLLNSFAWDLLTNEAIQYRDLRFAMTVAKAAYDADPQDAAIVDTYARALFDTGKHKDAIEYQKKAVELAKENERMQAELRKTLQRYERAAG